VVRHYIARRRGERAFRRINNTISLGRALGALTRPMPADLVKVDATAGGLVQGAIVGAGVDTPQLRVGQVR
jgi:hypothetical protein